MEDFIIGSEDDVAPAVNGAAYIFSGTDNSLIRTLISPALETGNDFGGTVAGLGDLNGDDHSEVLVGASSEDGGATNAFIRTLISPFAQASGHFGGAVTGLGDLNNDGRSDLLIGADDEDRGGIDGAGAAYVFISTPCTFSQPRIYWSEATPNPDRIAHAELDGSDIQSAVNNLKPALIALDANNQMLYWTDPTKSLVQRAPIGA